MRHFATLCLLAILFLPTRLLADTPTELLNAGWRAASQGDASKAEELATKAITADEELASAYYLRGRERFRLNKMKESLQDFDRYIELDSKAASRQWERGITCYYAGEFQKGAEQFELYQTYHDNDVENSVWRYLCVAQWKDIATAKKTILPIKNDRRVPMMEIFKLYQGTSTPEAVLVAARAGDPPRAVLDGRMFYTHLYLGLYYEVNDKADQAKEHILKAAALDDENLAVNRYMWDVARIHALRYQDK